MMSAPQPYPTVGNNTPAPDDHQIESKMPSICVDYLSHQWTDEDVWSSWKAMTKRKNEIANGVRLENASWRTWAKQRGKLKTISPETLNWLKDSDVTWLYGPLHEHADPVPPPKQATTADRLDLEDSHGKKSILKHRTISELLTNPPRAASPALELNDPLDLDADEDEASLKEAKKSALFSVRSDSNLASRNSKRNAGSPPHTARFDEQPYFQRTESSQSEEKRHISFNQRVEQCIAVDRDEVDYDDYDDDEEYDEEESSEDDVLTMRSSARASPMSSTHSVSFRHSSLTGSDHATIAKLAPTRLKTSEVYPAPSPAVVDPTGFIAQYGGSSPSVPSYPHAYGYSAPSGATGASIARGVQWDVDEDFSGDFDYFNGPDINEDHVGHGHHGGNDLGPVFNTGDAATSPDNARQYGISYFDHSDHEPQQDSLNASASLVEVAGDQGVTGVGPRGILKKRPNSGQGPFDEFDGRVPETDGNVDGSGGSHQESISPSSFSDSHDSAKMGGAGCERGRPSQRLGSSASYERIQEAARSSRTRSNSNGSGTSLSPTGAMDIVGPRNAVATNGILDERSSSSPGSPIERRESFRAKEGPRLGGDRDDRGFQGSFEGKVQSTRLSSSRHGIDNDSDAHGSHPSLSSQASPQLGFKQDQHQANGISNPSDRYTDSALYGDDKSYWSDDTPSTSASAPGSLLKPKSAGTKTTPAPAVVASGAELSVDVENIPSNAPRGNNTFSPDGQSFSEEVGPTPLNTPTFVLSRSSGKRRSGSGSQSGKDAHGGGPNSPTLPRRTSATGALVAPHNSEPRVPLAHDYVEEDEGGIVGRAVEIVNTARDLIGALLGTGDRGRSWREG
ncbi:hypothetical protein IE53DRAFT_315092 [Violaceomyces palustris]|uniref:Uncharacterized protein n=1 Tax=Violaceomyces palustris TaxID=1673888 RepID=A0ACD0NYF6_9BASI|nr:hypothetical protein IE53DRAFT_315092 [Violaceomyces palustris]